MEILVLQAHGEFGKDCYRCDVCLNFGTIHPDLLTVALPLLVLLVPLLPEECNIVHSPEDVCKAIPAKALRLLVWLKGWCLQRAQTGKGHQITHLVLSQTHSN